METDSITNLGMLGDIDLLMKFGISEVNVVGGGGHAIQKGIEERGDLSGR